MTHPPNVMPEELQRAHYIMQIVKLENLNAELLAALKACAFRLSVMTDFSEVNTIAIARANEAISKLERKKERE